MRSAFCIGLLLLLGVNTLLPSNAGEQSWGPAVVGPARVSEELRIRYPAASPSSIMLPNGELREIKSLLRVGKQMAFGDYTWDDEGVPEGAVWVRVDLSRQILSVFRAGEEIGTAIVIFGADEKPTPSGIFPVLAKAEQHRSSLYDAEMPFMLRLTGDGVAIHESDVRMGAATHGCIGVPPEFARLLFQQVHLGDKVAIVA